nr:MAG TPA: hypothetical protein [Caudoviricetes sp.]
MSQSFKNKIILFIAFYKIFQLYIIKVNYQSILMLTTHNFKRDW